ncbi:unnamed protein product, partial [Laminaria digitata]
MPVGARKTGCHYIKGYRSISDTNRYWYRPVSTGCPVTSSRTRMLTPGSVLLIFRLLSEPAFTPIAPGPAPIWHTAPTWVDLQSERHGGRPRRTQLPRRPTYKASAMGIGRGSARRASTTTTDA